MNDTNAVPNPLAHKKPRLDTSEEQIQRWILSLQRLIKGKIRFTKEVCPLPRYGTHPAREMKARDKLTITLNMVSNKKALEQLSTMLGQIDSVRKDLDDNIPIVRFSFLHFGRTSAKVLHHR